MKINTNVVIIGNTTDALSPERNVIKTLINKIIKLIKFLFFLIDV